LCSYSEFGALSVKNKLLLGVTVPPDEIAVELIDGPQQPFSVQFKVPQFHKRMRISKLVQLHFIARGSSVQPSLLFIRGVEFWFRQDVGAVFLRG
jgi:hypothetical protein